MSMTKLLDQALEAARNLPPEAQDDIAHVVLRLAGADDEPPVTLTPRRAGRYRRFESRRCPWRIRDR